jgi:hypothetical protein
VFSKAPALRTSAALVSSMSDASPVRLVNNLKRAPEESELPRNHKRSRLEPGPALETTKVSEIRQQMKSQVYVDPHTFA